MDACLLILPVVDFRKQPRHVTRDIRFARIVLQDHSPFAAASNLADYERKFAEWKQQSAPLRRELQEVESAARSQAGWDRRRKFPADVLAAIRMIRAELPPHLADRGMLFAPVYRTAQRPAADSVPPGRELPVPEMSQQPIIDTIRLLLLHESQDEAELLLNTLRKAGKAGKVGG